MDLILRKLRLSDEQAFRLANDEFQEPGFHFAHGFDPQRPFQDYLDWLEEKEDPTRIPSDRVPVTYMCGFLGPEIIGRVSIRHGLSEWIKEVGGHIGYGIVPRFRGRGFSHLLLKDSLRFCQSLGLKQVLLTCDDDNTASVKTIERSGGVFERLCADSSDGIKKRRYWIAL